VTVERAADDLSQCAGDRHRDDRSAIIRIIWRSAICSPEHASCPTTSSPASITTRIWRLRGAHQGATNYEKKLKKKVQTSGCAQGTVFGD